MYGNYCSPFIAIPAGCAPIATAALTAFFREVGDEGRTDGEAGAAVVELRTRHLTVSEPEGGWMATEYLQFAGALVFFIAILIGSYWFVYVPNRGGREGEDEG
jgi:hypothetical protein